MADNQNLAKVTRVPIALAIVTVFTVLSCVCVVLRLYTRRLILRNVGPDDYAILVAQILGLGITAINYAILIAGGAGRHIEFVEDKLPTFTRLLMAAVSVYNATQIATKTSLLLQYGSIFPDQTMRFICRWGIKLLLVWGVAQQIFTPFICSFEMITFLTPETCLIDNPVVTLNAVMNMVTDVLILLIPVKPILQLHINMLRKIYLLIILCLGLAVCIISAIRLYMLVAPQYDWTDITWETAVAAYLSTIETSLGIVCACVPTLRPLIKRISPNIVGSSDKDPSSCINRYSSRWTRFMDEGTLKTKTTQDNAIYIQKDIRFQSTTELKDIPPKEPYSVSHRSSDDIVSLEQITYATSKWPTSPNLT